MIFKITALAVASCIFIASQAIAAGPQWVTPPKVHTLDVIADFGAKGDCASDDSAAFNNAISTLAASPAKGGALHVPTPPFGCYLVNSPIVLLGQSAAPDKYSITIFGDGPSTIIRAGAAIDAVLQKDSTFNRGYFVHDLTLDGNKLATHDFHLFKGGENRLFDMWFTNVAPGGSNVRIEDGENFITDSYFQNDPNVITVPANLPTYNLDVESGDNHFSNNVLWNASACNIYDNGADNHYVANHGYNYPATYPVAHNFCANGGSIWSDNTADTSSASGFYITGYGAHFTNNHAISAGTMPIGYEIASGVQNVLLVGNWADETTVTAAIQQDGSPGVNTVIFANAGVAPVYSNIGPIISGMGNSVGSAIAGYLGGYGNMHGAQSFGYGNNVNDFYRSNCGFHAGPSFSYAGDAQTSECIMQGKGASGTVNILAGNNAGTATLFGTNEIRMRTDIIGSMHVTVDLNALCVTGDHAAWTTTFILTGNKTVASIAFGATPTWTVVPGASSGASGWTPGVALDAANGAAYLTGTGACTGGKAIYWTAKVTAVESGASQ